MEEAGEGTPEVEGVGASDAARERLAMGLSIATATGLLPLLLCPVARRNGDENSFFFSDFSLFLLDLGESVAMVPSTGLLVLGVPRRTSSALENLPRLSGVSVGVMVMTLVRCM